MANEIQDWDESDGAIEGVCERCGKACQVKPCHDPFVAEGINEGNPDETSLLCYPCFDDWCDDV